MESPTVELTRNLEALKLVPPSSNEESRLLHRESPITDESMSQVNSFQGLAQNVNQDRSSQLLVLQSQPAPIGAMHSLPSLNEQTPLLFSHLEHRPHSTPTSEVTSSTCCSCGHRSDTTSHGCDIDGPTCPSCGGRLVRVTASNSNTDEDIATSFSSLSVSPISDGVSLASSSLRSSCSHMSCRQQAAACRRSYFDDTTVDDLAGYLDEIMFLPKPMSEMAELMYT